MEHFDEWRKAVKELNADLQGPEVRRGDREGHCRFAMYPDYVEAGNVYELLADAYLAKGDKPAAIAATGDVHQTGGRSPATAQEAGDARARSGRKNSKPRRRWSG